jgi:2-(1,2-epoxy-1,2-dihydrophenyl)acetyl-CoA isomerase
MTDTIRVEQRAGWRKLVLNRPDKLNALTEEMMTALIAALDAARNDRACRAVLLTGEGRGFCAGQELSPSLMPGPDGPPDLGRLADTYHHQIVRRIRDLPMPVVCAVNGVAAGAGAGFALACDIVLAGRSASFIQVFGRIGLTLDSGNSFFLPRLVGDARARALAMLTEPVPAEKAEAWGMIWKAVDDDALDAEVDAIAAKLASLPPLGLAAIKEMIRSSWQYSLDEELERQAGAMRRLGFTADYREGVAAFLEKRKPIFLGR